MVFVPRLFLHSDSQLNPSSLSLDLMLFERKMSHRDDYRDVFSVLEDKEDFSECFYSQPALLTGEFYQQRTSQNKHDTQPSHSQIINDQHLLPTLPMSACFSNSFLLSDLFLFEEFADDSLLHVSVTAGD
uniref:Uncharacterized protein n=1 Tax=Nothobranchius kuhntae TaxID=321403 RepID=A0A1A8J258_NOTKU